MPIKPLFETVQRYPQQTALCYASACWSWKTLFEQIEQLANQLAVAGINSGDHVALYLPNSPAFIISYFAVLMRGAIVLPLNSAFKQGDCAHYQIAVVAVMTTQRLFAQCRQALDKTLATQADYWVCQNPEQGDVWECVTTRPACNIIPYEYKADAPALLMYSSGTTGIPKPLYRTHRQCEAEMQHFRETCQIEPTDRIFCTIPLFHAHGMANALWAAVRSGATLVLMPHPQPFALQGQRALQLLEAEKITIFPCVPLQLQTLVDIPATADLSALRLCFSAGNPLSTTLFDGFLAKFAVPIRQLYGCTEAGSISIDLTTSEKTGLTVGFPMRGVAIEIRDETGQILPTSEIGSIAIKSKALTSGYIDNISTNSFHAEWFLTGDMGYLDTQGRLNVVGRKAFIMLVAGHKVYAQEIEAVLMQHPKILEVAIIGVPNPDLADEQLLKAFIVAHADLTEFEVQQYCQAQLPIFKRPQTIVFIKQLPKDSLGKVMKTQLQ